MNPKFLIKMVLTGMKKNIRTLIPFLASSSLMIMVFYIMDSILRGGIRGDDGNLLFYGAKYFKDGTIVVNNMPGGACAIGFTELITSHYF